MVGGAYRRSADNNRSSGWLRSSFSEGTRRGMTWYEEFVPVADTLYDDHVASLKREGWI